MNYERSSPNSLASDMDHSSGPSTDKDTDLNESTQILGTSDSVPDDGFGVNPIVKSFPQLSDVDQDSLGSANTRDGTLDVSSPRFASANTRVETVTPYFARGRQLARYYESPDLERFDEPDTQPVAAKLDEHATEGSDTQLYGDDGKSRNNLGEEEEEEEEEEESPMFNNGGRTLDLAEVEFSQVTPGVKGNSQRRTILSKLRNGHALYEDSPLRAAETPSTVKALRHLQGESPETDSIITPGRRPNNKLHNTKRSEAEGYAEDATQPVNRYLDIVTELCDPEPPKTVVKPDRPFTQVLGTPYALDSSNSSGVKHRSDSPNALSVNVQKGRRYLSARTKSIIYDRDDETQIVNEKSESEDASPVAISQSNDTIVSDPEESGTEQSKEADNTVVSSSELLSSSPAKSADALPTNSLPPAGKRSRKRRLPSSAEDQHDLHDGTSEAVRGSHPASPVKTKPGSTPSPVKSSLALSPSLTPGHSKVRMKYFDERQFNTPTKRRTNDEKQDAAPSELSADSRPVISSYPMSSYKETGVWLPWNDGKWWAARVVKGAPLGVSYLFDKPSLSIGTSLCVVDKTETENIIPVDGVKRLHLQVGDRVKWDSDKKRMFEIIELMRVSADSDCIRSQGGFDSVNLRLLVGNKEATGQDVIYQASIGDLYMTATQVKAYLLSRKQEIEPFPTQNGKFTGYQEMTSQMTQLSRRKKLTSGIKYLEDDNDDLEYFGETGTNMYGSPLKNTGLLSTVPSYASKVSKGIFAGCVFTVSSIDGEPLRNLYTKIVANGGAVCKEGLHELFKIDYQNYRMEWSDDVNKARFNFGAVLSKELLRTPKYLEAVALGWPCLSWRFIDDCIRAGELLEESIYLLSAGMSEKLDNTAKSHDISLFKKNRADGASLYDQFEKRKKIMSEVNVPVYCVDRVSGAAEIVKLLLMIMGTKTIGSTRPSSEVAQGVIVVDPAIKSEEDTTDANDTRKARSYTPYLNYNEIITNSQDGRLPTSVYYNREWVIQCIINGRMV